MKSKLEPTWIVVMDSAVAYFYALHDGETGRHIEPVAETMHSHLHRHSSDLKSDGPGRGFRASNSAARHAMEPPHDYHKLEKHDFVHAVSQFLERAYDDHKFKRLAIVAPERGLGELRLELPEKVKRTVWHEIAKDLVKLGQRDLWARLATALDESRSSGSG